MRRPTPPTESTTFPAGALEPTEVYLTSAVPIGSTEVGVLTARLAGVPGVASVLPPRVAVDGRTVDLPVVLRDDPYGTAALDLVSGPLRADAAAAAPAGTSALIGGQTMALADLRATTVRDLRVIFPVAGLLFVLILALMLRAVLAPVYLVLLVVTGFAATLGASALLFRAGLAFSIPIILYLSSPRSEPTTTSWSAPDCVRS